MTKLLTSVMSVEEAWTALECGADIIDCKDPSSGALGALRDETIAAIVKYVDGRRPVSATIGDLPMEPDLICAAVKAKIKTGVDYVKIGIFYSSHRRSLPRIAIRGRHRNGGLIKTHLEECFAAVQTLASQTSLIAVLFADRSLDVTLLSMVADAGFTGVMLDTANKSGGGLTSRVSYALLARFVSKAQEFGLTAGLAGSLKIKDVPRLLKLSPDYLGFRSALCVGNRTSSIDCARATAIRRAMHAAHLPVIERTTAARCAPSR